MATGGADSVLGYQGYRVRRSGTLEVWSKPLVGNHERAVALLNRGTTAANIAVSWIEVGLAAGPASVRDLWKHEELGEHAYGISVLVEPDATVLLKESGSPPAAPRGRAFLSDLTPTYAANYWGHGGARSQQRRTSGR